MMLVITSLNFFPPKRSRFFSAYFLYLLTLTIFIFSTTAQAHSRGESYSKWQITEQGADLTFTIALKDISKLSDYFQGSEPAWQERVTAHIEQKTQLAENNFPCKKITPFTYQISSAFLQVKGQYRCNAIEKLQINIDSLFEIDTRHMHIARVNFIDGNISEQIFLDRDREWLLYNDGESTGAQGSTVFNYLIIGVEHIVTGWDHLAFLAAICLLLLLRQASGKTLFIIISGFTLGHSASLIFTVLGYLHPNGLVVESLIALSITLLAIESVAFKNKQYFLLSLITSLALLLYLFSSQFIFNSAITWLSMLGLAIFVVCYFNLSSQSASTTPQLLLTLLFGLVHGFGFAGSLQDIGLPQDRLILALLSFNLGVELGQLVIVGITLFILLKIKQWLPQIKKELPVDLSAAFLAGLGMFWFIERSVL